MTIAAGGASNVQETVDQFMMITIVDDRKFANLYFLLNFYSSCIHMQISSLL